MSATHGPMPSSHPSEDLLIAHTLGQLRPSQRVLIEAHLALCLSCAGQHGSFLAAGARYLRQQPDEAPDEHVWRRINDQLDREPREEASWAATPLPASARAEIPRRSRPLTWRRIPLSPAHFARLPLEEPLFLLQIPGGRRFPRHIHQDGAETVVILAGGYRDHVGHFAVGDFQAYPQGSEHEPDVDPEEPCWIVAHITGELRFLGWRGWLQRLLTKRRRSAGNATHNHLTA